MQIYVKIIKTFLFLGKFLKNDAINLILNTMPKSPRKNGIQIFQSSTSIITTKKLQLTYHRMFITVRSVQLFELSFQLFIHWTSPGVAGLVYL